MSDDNPQRMAQAMRLKYVVKGEDGIVYGPAPMLELMRWVRAQRLGPATLVAEEGTENWRRADTFLELQMALGGTNQRTMQALREGRAPVETEAGADVDFGEVPQSADGMLMYRGLTAARNPKTDGMAGWSLGSGIVSFFLCPGLFGLLAIVLGAIAWVRIRKSGGRTKGTGFAVAGVILGVLSIALRVAIVIYFILNA